MGLKKRGLLFLLGGSGYVALELLYRRRSHISMFLAGGSSFLLLGALERRMRGASLPVRAAAGSGVITAVELITGSLFNRQHQVWDYRPLPLNYKGQICMGFSLLWMPLSLGAMTLYRKLWR